MNHSSAQIIADNDQISISRETHTKYIEHMQNVLHNQSIYIQNKRVPRETMEIHTTHRINKCHHTGT